MKCKNCNAELEDGVTVCPSCGQDNGQVPEAPEKKQKTGKIVLAVVGCVLLAGVLVCALLYGMGYDFKPKANDISYKASYTQEDSKAEKTQNKVVATLGDYELTNGELQIYYQSAVVDFTQRYGYMSGIDPMKPLDQQVQDPQTGLTWQQFFLDNSIKTWQRYTTLRMMAKEENFQMKEETKTFLEGLQKNLEETAAKAGFPNAEALVKDEMGANATVDGYYSYMNTYYESLNYYDSVYEKMVPTVEEMEAYFDAHAAEYEGKKITKDGENLVDVRHLLVEPEGGTPAEDGMSMVYSDEAWAECEQKAQQILDEWKAGDASEESFGKLAGEKTADTGSKNSGGLYQNVKKGQMVPTFDAWIFDEARQSGDTGLVKSPFGYHIMYFVSSHPAWQKTVGDDMVNERTNQLLEDGMAKWPMQISYKKIVLSDPMAKRQQQQPTIPEVTAPVTTAPDASAPETTAPETTVPETTAPAESAG